MVARMTHRLAREGQTATVEEHGGVLSSYRDGDRELLAGVESAGSFAYRGSLLAPWPNRVAGGGWSWQGQELQLPVNDEAAGSALHGLVYDVPFVVEQSSADAITLTHALQPHPGYPFPLRVSVSYALRPDGLACSLRADNTGTVPAPVGLGVHPYLGAPDGVDRLRLTLPVRSRLLMDPGWRETGREDVSFDERLLEDVVLDAAFTDLTGDTATVTYPDGTRVELWSGPTCRGWVVYTGDTLPPDAYRRSIAVEPQTCLPDALNSGAIDVLEPGQSLTLEWGLRLVRAGRSW
jgi:aldose 1-epimerase